MDFVLLLKAYLFGLVEQYGNLSMAVLLMLEFIGAPVPGEPLMAFLGFITNKSGNSLFWAVFFSVVGTNIGSTFAFAIGYRFGDPVLHQYGKYFFVDDDKIQKTKQIMEKYELLLLLFSRYIPGVRHVVPYLCGIMRLSFWKYTFYSFLGSVIWCVSFVVPGYYLGENWHAAFRLIEEYALMTTLALGYVGIVFFFGRRFMTEWLVLGVGVYGYFQIHSLVIGGREEPISGESYAAAWVYDLYFRNNFGEWMTPFWTSLMRGVTQVGTWTFFVSAVVLSFIYLHQTGKMRRLALYLGLNTLLAYGLGSFLKSVFERARPSIERLGEAVGFSFPSIHALTAAAFFVLLAFFIAYIGRHRMIKIISIVLCALMVLTVSFSRVYLGVHYESDVIAGMSLGLILSAGMAMMLKWTGHFEPLSSTPLNEKS